MSSDYNSYIAETIKIFENEARALLGEETSYTPETTHLITTHLPVLLSMELSQGLRTFLLLQYVEIQGTLRDMHLGELSREDLYRHASLVASREQKRSALKKSWMVTTYESIKLHLTEEDQAILKQLDEEHEEFKTQLENVVKSKLNIAEEENIRPVDTLLYISEELRKLR